MSSTLAKIYDETAYINAFKLSGGEEIIGANEVRTITSISSSTPTFGQRFVFNVSAWGTENWLTQLSLITTVSAVSKTGGTYARLCNCFAFFMFDRIEIYQNGKIFSTYYPHQMYHRYMQDWSEEEALIECNLIGDLSDTDRNTAAASPQTFVLHMSDFIALFAKPLPLFLLKDPIQIHFYMRSNMSELVQTDGTNPSFTYTDCHLSARYCEPIGKYQINKLVSASPFPLVDEDFKLVQRQVIGNGSTKTFAFNLQEINNSIIVQLPFFINKQSDKAAGKHDVYQKIESFTLRQASKYLTDEQYDITDKIYRYEILPFLDADGINALFKDNLYTICFADHLYRHLRHHLCAERYSGSKFFHNTPDAEFSITYGSAPADNQDVYIFAECVRRAQIRDGNLETL